jgi:hypothetical protein
VSTALIVWAIPAAAHHSHGNYLMTEYTALEGTVTELLWINPHTWIYLEVMGEDGEPTLWALEGGSPGSLTRRGWSRESVEAGDTISVRCHQLRDRSPGCLLGFVTPQGGEEKEWD